MKNGGVNKPNICAKTYVKVPIKYISLKKIKTGQIKEM